MKYRLDEIVLAMQGLRYFRFIFFLFPWNWHRRVEKPLGERIRLALIELGPIFVKFGQLLSTRRDLLPDEVADELAKLQDRVPPFSSEVSKQLIERFLKKSTDHCFLEFSQTPLASASVAQVHAAKLHDGSEVVVKVLRPSIRKIIRRDIALLRTIARLIERASADGRRLRPRDVVYEFEKTIMDELDLQREAANAAQLRRNFDKSSLLYVPKIHWPLVRKNVLVMERIYGIPISDVDALTAAKVDLKVLAERGVEIFFTQVFRDCFFHADMHPGNIFVSTQQPKNPQYIAVDFGIIGTLGEEDQRYLAGNFLAFFNRDYRRVAQLHIESGWVPVNTRLDEFESAIRTVCEPIFQQPLKEISFGKFLMHLFSIARRFNMEVQPQLVLLQKTLVNIEGLGRQLYPDLDLWTTAKPYLQNWMEERTSPKTLWHQLTESAPIWAGKLPHLPEMIMRSLEAKPTSVAKPSIDLHRLEAQVVQASRRQFWGMVLGSLVIASAILLKNA